ncbi:hypothetical protein DFQ27_009719 [Actinomortierella ambigua]|uniref:Calponin-homology (CH) domain-containing protein n=1 Tax=Actinomortierella ambigua TaxID=1343610 RepID=A0A9P6TWP9_9FUNG|nr:hypothetical protein DFQ27_009719 [Actinomortierella ambigua]
MNTLQSKDTTASLRGGGGPPPPPPPPPTTTAITNTTVATSSSSVALFSATGGIRTWNTMHTMSSSENEFKVPPAGPLNNPALLLQRHHHHHQQQQPGTQLNGNGSKRKLAVQDSTTGVKVHRRQASTVDQPFSTPLAARSASSLDQSSNINTTTIATGSSSRQQPTKLAAASTRLSSSSSSSSPSSAAATASTPTAESKTLSTLILAPFQPSPWIDFGKVRLGHKHSVPLFIENPTDMPERIKIDGTCKMEEKGFNIDPLDPLLQQQQQQQQRLQQQHRRSLEPLVVPAKSTIEVTVSWTPFTAGTVRASAILKSTSGRFMVNLHGCGETLPAPIPADPMKASMLRQSRYGQKGAAAGGGASLRESTIAAMKQSQWRTQSTRSDSLYTPPAGYSTLPYVTTNEMYDERWIDRQERSFSQWLNHEFHVTVDMFSARDPSSWSYYSHKLEYEHTRASAFKIYQSDTFKIVLLKVDDAMAKDRLKIKPDCNLVGDVTARCEVIELLFSYDVRWLVLGLETTTGMATSVTPSFDRSTISAFINKFQKAMNRLVLKRLFMIILFLDKSKQAKLIPSDPCLFNKESDIKSSRQLLTTISKRFLMGEGDIIRHLLFMGYSVLHTQEPLDEYDFTVKNLAVDMRDGVRLCRLIDLHCPDVNLGAAHMQQNVNLALNALVSQGIALEGTRGGILTARDIVEGHREKTFGLLWKLILNWKVPVLVDLQSLLAEIMAIKKEYRRMYGVNQPEQLETVYFTSDQLSALLRWCQAIAIFYGIQVTNFTTSFSDGRAFGALLSYYHPSLLDMNEMKNSAQYLEEVKQGLHPIPAELLPVGDQNGKGFFINTKDLPDPVTTAKEMDRFNFRMLHSKVQALGGVPVTMRPADHQSPMGVPDEKAVILFVTYLCARLMHLNKDIRAAKTIQRLWREKRYGRQEEHRARAVLVIQRYVRAYQSRKRAEVQQRRKRQAVTLIQTGCRAYLARQRARAQLEQVELVQRQCRVFLFRKQFIEYRWAALTIQRYWRGLVGRREFAQEQEELRLVCAFQAHVRGSLVRKRFFLLKLAAEVVITRRRAQLEGRRVRQVVGELRAACLVVQRRRRALVEVRQMRSEFLALRAWATHLQATVLGVLARQRYRETLDLQWACMVVQRRRREFVETRATMHRFADLRWAASVVQARWRAQVEARRDRARYLALRAWAVQIQAQVRRTLALTRYRQVYRAALVIQERRRAEVAMREQRHRFLMLQAAACVIQDRWRAMVLGRQTRVAYLEQLSTIVQMQAAIRGFVFRRRLACALRENKAAVTIQSAWRGHQARLEVRVLRTVVGVQAMVRAKMARWEYERRRHAAVIIQQRWRARRLAQAAQAEYAASMQAALVIQRRWRALVLGRQVREEVRLVYRGIILLQARIRGVLARARADRIRWLVLVQSAVRGALVRSKCGRELHERREQAARTIQAFWRTTVETREVRYAFEERRWAALVMQRHWRRVLEERADFEAQSRAAVVIQAAIRGFLARRRVQAYLEHRATVLNWWVDLTEQSLAAMVIQRAWRRTRSRRRAELEHFAASKIQCWWQYRRSLRFQTQLDRIMAGVQAQIRGCLARMRADREVGAVVTIQAWWRGYVVRREASATIRAARRRIEHANATAEEHMKLGNRTTMALDILLSSGQLSSVLKACYHLDVVTRLSKNSCLRLVEHNVVNIIFRLIRSCNRSQPHMEVLKHALNIVENLSRDPDTIAPVFWAPEGMEILVDTVQAYRENEMVLGSAMTILLIHIEANEGRQRALKNRMPAEIKKLRGVLTVLERKLDREMKSHHGHRSHHHPSQGAAGAGGLQQLTASVNKLRKAVHLLT